MSELTETALKVVWRNHGENYGRSPSGRIYRQAQWSARDLKVGGSERDRRGLNVALEDLHEALRGQLLVDSCDYEAGTTRRWTWQSWVRSSEAGASMMSRRCSGTHGTAVHGKRSEIE